MGKPSAPASPDYAGAAREQGIANKEAGVSTASLSNPNIYSPYGNQTVSYANTGPDGNPQPTINQTLTPDAQRTLDAQQRVQYGLANLGEQGLNTAGGVLNTPFNYTGQNINPNLDLSGVAKMPVNAGTTGQQAIMRRLQPQIEQNQKATQQRLANQGIASGSEAYSNDMRYQNEQENDLYSQAALQGLGLDMTANNQGFNQALQTGQFGNQAALQQYQQQLAQYNQPLNQITALMSGSQIQNPQFQQYTGANIQAAPLFQGAQAQGNFDMGLYGQQMAGYNSMMGGIGDLFGTAGKAAGGGFFG